jgi:hypothetical protein
MSRGFITRRDENEGAIIAEFAAAGAHVARLSQAGVPDLLVAYRGRMFLVEVIGPNKAAKYRATGGLTPAQVRWHANWHGPAIAKVRTRAEALAAIGAGVSEREVH